ncbi:hypothetical protein MMC30_004004 [Trapelia coarctata]|nr:hypothetical protein [Trapelia coarctata]
MAPTKIRKRKSIGDYNFFKHLLTLTVEDFPDEMSKMQAILHAMDKTDSEQGEGQYLMSHTLDKDRENIPNTWPESRIQLMERMERKALEYGTYIFSINDSN